MLRGKLFVVLISVLGVACNAPAPEQAKGSLFIIGGGSRPPAMIDRIIEEAGLKNGGYGIILPMSSGEQDSAVWYANQAFIERGVKNIYGLPFFRNIPDSALVRRSLSDTSVHVAKTTEIDKAVYDRYFTAARIDSIRNAKFIYISGGDQVVFMDIAGSTDIIKAIHDAYDKGAMIAGTSAGAAVMSKVMITGNELKKREYSATFRSIEPSNIETRDGLGMLTTVVIDQHFVRRSRYNRLLTAILEHPELKGIGIDESTAMFVKGDLAEVVGVSQILVFDNKKGMKSEKGEKYGVRGVELSIYLPGETFSLK